MPGEVPEEAVAVVTGELVELPHVVELPGRGPGADLVGRAAALLVDLHVDLQPSGWRLVDRPGLDERRAASYLAHDLDAFEERTQGRTGHVKVQVSGPWTLAAALRLPRGEPVLSDRGACRDVVVSLAEAAVQHVQDVRRRLPGATVLLQLDEPSLPAVLEGAVRSASGARTFAPVAGTDAESALRELVDTLAALDVPVAVHCCAARPPLDLFRRAGAAAVSVDLTAMGTYGEEALAEAVEGGVVLFAGLVPAVGGPLPKAGPIPEPRVSDLATTVEPVRRLWSRAGLAPETLATGVVVTPTCGMAGASPDHARAALRLALAAGRVLVEEPEG